MSEKRRDNIIDLPDIFQSLANKSWTGTLHVEDFKGERNVYLHWNGGVVRHVKADASGCVLGTILYKLGKIDEAELTTVLAEFENTGRRLGEACIELGMASEEDIHEALRFQATETVLGLFSGEDLDANFHPGDVPLPSVFSPQDLEVPVMLAPMGLLMEAARRADEWEVVRRKIPSLDEVLAATDAAATGEVAAGNKRRIMSLADGFRTVHEIAESTPCPDFEAYKAMEELVTEGLLRTLEPLEIVRTAITREKEGNLLKALTLYELAESRGLDRLDLSKRIAHVCHKVGRKEEAKRRWIDLAERCTKIKRDDLALEGYHQAIRIDPVDTDCHQKLAVLLVSSGRQQEAGTQYRHLIARLEEKGDDEKTLWAISEYLELVPDDPEALERSAQLNLAADERIQAIVRLDELGGVYQAAGAAEKAIEVYHRILDIDDECLEARLQLAETLGKIGSTDDAVREYKRLADTLYRSGVIGNSINWPFLIKVYESIVELEPNSTPAWEWLAKAYVENSQTDLGISRYIGMAASIRAGMGGEASPDLIQPLRKIIELDSSRSDIRRELAEVFTELHQFEKATKAYHELAEYALSTHDLMLAEEAYGAALTVVPFDIKSHGGLALLHETRGETEAAGEKWRAIGGLNLRAGLLTDAAEALRHSLQMQADHPQALRELAEAEQQMSLNGEAAETLVQYAEVQFEADNLGEARLALERAQQLNPAHAAAGELLDRVVQAKRV